MFPRSSSLASKAGRHGGRLFVLTALLAARSAGADASSFLSNMRQTAVGTGHVTGNSQAAGSDLFLGTIGRVIQAGLALVGVIFLILTIYAGYLWMTAAGNDSQVGKAKDTLRNVIIGLVVVMAAYAITAFVSGELLFFTSHTPNPPMPEYGH